MQAASSAGKALLKHAKEIDAGLIVMGAYGHSRLREFVFGGATRHVLDDMTAPRLDVALILNSGNDLPSICKTEEPAMPRRKTCFPVRSRRHARRQRL